MKIINVNVTKRPESAGGGFCVSVSGDGAELLMGGDSVYVHFQNDAKPEVEQTDRCVTISAN